jgi:hypothetical protein
LGRKKSFIIDKRERFPYSEHEFDRIRPYQDYEVVPVLSRLFGEDMAEFPKLSELFSEPERYDEYTNEVLTMYIIIRNVSVIEYYLRHAASKIVDDKINSGEGIDFSKFFSYDFEADYAKAYGESGTRRIKLTKGQAFAAQYDFVNLGEINWVFRRLLGKNLFDTLKGINKDAGKHTWRRCRPRGLRKNWKKFTKMFEQRNDIVHTMKRVRLSKEELCSLCNNTDKFIEQTNVLVYGTVPGGNAEQDSMHEEITAKERLHREELERTSKPSKKKKKKTG